MRVAILVPCYQRHEYTKKCLDALVNNTDTGACFFITNDGSDDETKAIIDNHPIQKTFKCFVTHHEQTQGLRRTILEFFKATEGFDLISKVDNDCIVPPHWLSTITDKFAHTNADILSPNVFPSNAAFKNSRPDKDNLGYRPSRLVGGLWTMKRSLIDGMDFENIEIHGITGAFNILRQIIVEKDPKCGWLPEITVQDIGHWSGEHPDHIKSEEHLLYSQEIGRSVAWSH